MTICNKNDEKIKSKSKFLRVGSAGICMIVCLTIMIALNLGPLAFVIANRKIPIYCVDRLDNKVAITFDAAWGADKTQQILDICDKYEIKATFFLVGFWTDKYVDLVKTINQKGHAIGTHSQTHPKMSQLTDEKITEELSNSMQKITAITGEEVKLFRPPFGDYNNNLINISNGLGLSVIQWNVDSLDWKGISGMQIANRVLKAESGSIILCHNNSDHIVDALPVIIEGIKAKGLEFVRVDELIYFDNFYIDHTGKQIQHLKDVK